MNKLDEIIHVKIVQIESKGMPLNMNIHKEIREACIEYAESVVPGKEMSSHPMFSLGYRKCAAAMQDNINQDKLINNINKNL